MALAAPAMALAGIAPASAQAGIELTGASAQMTQTNDTAWELNNTGEIDTSASTVTWTITATRRRQVLAHHLLVEGTFTVHNGGADAASIGNVVVNLQTFSGNRWTTISSDLADATNGEAATSAQLVAKASSEKQSQFAENAASGPLRFIDADTNTFFALPPKAEVPPGTRRTFLFSAAFDNDVLGLPIGTATRAEILVSFGNAARGNSGPNLDINGNGVIDADEAHVRTVPTRLGLTVPVPSASEVLLANPLDDISATGTVTFSNPVFDLGATTGTVSASYDGGSHGGTITYCAHLASGGNAFTSGGLTFPSVAALDPTACDTLTIQGRTCTPGTPACYREFERTEPLNLVGATPGQSRTGVDYEYDMTEGRLNKVPVSWVFSGVVTQSGGSKPACCGPGRSLPGALIEFRARCVDPDAPADVCDPALYVYWKNMRSTDSGATWSVMSTGVSVNNDAHASTRDAYVSVTNCAAEYTRDYYVQAYSAIRGTSNVNVEYRLNGGLNGEMWTDAFRTGTTRSGANPDFISGNNQHVGGTMVRIGPVQSEDRITLMSPSSASGEGPNALGKDARLWVFNAVKGLVGSEGSTDASRNPSSDPLLSPWLGGSKGVPSEVYALLSLGATKRTTSEYGTAGWVEKYYDLVHYPVSVGAEPPPRDSGIGESSSRQSGYCPSVSLLPGHYQWIFSVATTKPVGSPSYKTSDPSDPNPESGTPNELAFAASICRGTEVMTKRYVTRAVIGTQSPYSTKISLELVVPDEPRYAGAEYSVCFDQIAPFLSISGSSEIVRNQDGGELRVATANMEYGESYQTEPQLKNAIDLLARSADYPGDGSVLYEDRRGRWRFDADLVNFNEILWDDGSENKPNIMRDRLTRNSGYNVWNAHSAPSRFCWVGCDDRMGILIQNGRATPGGAWSDGTPIFMEPQVHFDAACECGVNIETERSVEGRHACATRDDFEDEDFTFVMRSAVNRVDGAVSGGYVGAPVMTVHIYYDSDESDDENREWQVKAVSSFLKELLERDPYGFNSAGSIEPLHAGNRIILIGDMNMNNTYDSEVNGHLEILRSAFGYAVDVAMASTDNNGDFTRTRDTRYGVLPLMDSRMLSATVGPPIASFEEWLELRRESRESAYRLPGPNDLDKYGSKLFHPWWNAIPTEFGGYKSRHDLVLLVGRGWAEDDPIRHYLVPCVIELPVMTEPNPNVGRNRYGEIEHSGIDIRWSCGWPNIVEGRFNAKSYEPEFTDVCSQDDATKKLVYKSDHKPVGARLRVRF
jgi:hypothetical protein